MVDFSVRHAILYRAGIGWFSAESEMNGDIIFFPVASKSLDDFLKTGMVGIKNQQTSVKNLSFETKGISKNLFSTSNAIVGMIDFLRGSEVKISGADGKKYEGKILGYQMMGEQNKNFLISLLSTSGEIQLIEGFKVQEIIPKSKKDLSQLQEFLASLTNESDTESQTLLKIELNDTGEFTIRVSFLTNIPAWKLAYRITIKDNNELHLETFGIVDNNTQVDWEDANLVLSTKTPVSFHYDLSTPHLINRPSISRVISTGISIPTPEPTANKMRLQSAVQESLEYGGSGLMGQLEQSYDEFSPSEEEYSYDYEDQAEVELGESIEYVLKQPVTIKRKQSSMVPLSSNTIKGYPMHYFNESNHQKHPFFMLELTNTLSHALDNGPISVYDQIKGNSNFKGEAMLPRVGKNDEYLLTYALDKNIAISKTVTNYEYKERINIQGVLLKDIYSRILVHEYTITNKSDEECNMYIGIPKTGYVPLKKEMHGFKPSVEYKDASNEYRVSSKQDAYSVKNLEFVMIQEYTRQSYLYNLGLKKLEELLKDESISENEKEIIHLIYDIGKELENLRNEKDVLQKRYERSKDRRTQIISTLEVLDKSSEDKTRKKYIEEIETIDHIINKLLKDIEELDTKISELNTTQQNYNILDEMVQKKSKQLYFQK